MDRNYKLIFTQLYILFSKCFKFLACHNIITVLPLNIQLIVSREGNWQKSTLRLYGNIYRQFYNTLMYTPHISSEIYHSKK
jgi:hypothetical protein